MTTRGFFLTVLNFREQLKNPLTHLVPAESLKIGDLCARGASFLTGTPHRGETLRCTIKIRLANADPSGPIRPILPCTRATTDAKNSAGRG